MQTVMLLMLQAAAGTRAASDSALIARGNPISPWTMGAIVVLVFAMGAYFHRRRARGRTPPAHR